MIESRFIKINDLEVSFLRKLPAAPEVTIVFIHGFPFSSAIWTQQLESLPGNVQGISYDIRGYGRSRGGHPYYSIDLFARDLLELLQSLSLKNVVLCGVSMGGYIALRALEISPERIKGLVLCDTNSASDTNEGKIKRFASIEQVIKDGKEVFADNFMKNIFSDKTFSDNQPLTESIREIILNTSTETICSTQMALASRTDTTDMLAAIKMPVLVVRGAEDRLMTQDQAEQLKDAIHGAELEVIPNSGHLPNCEASELFNDILNSYLRKHFLS